MLMDWFSAEVCQHCNGRGWMVTTWCTGCGGTGKRLMDAQLVECGECVGDGSCVQCGGEGRWRDDER